MQLIVCVYFSITLITCEKSLFVNNTGNKKYNKNEWKKNVTDIYNNGSKWIKNNI